MQIPEKKPVKKQEKAWGRGREQEHGRRDGRVLEGFLLEVGTVGWLLQSRG